MATHKPPPPKRSYEQYEELGPLFVGANASIKEGDLEQAAEDLDTHVTHELEIAANLVTPEKLLELLSRADESAARSGSSA